MSRSYKHTPYAGDKKDKFFKKYANKKLRRKKLTHNLQHKSYKKDFCHYDICDYYHIETTNFEKFYEDCINNWLQNQGVWYLKGEPFPTRKECWKKYLKWYKRK